MINKLMMVSSTTTTTMRLSLSIFLFLTLVVPNVNAFTIPSTSTKSIIRNTATFHNDVVRIQNHHQIISISKSSSTSTSLYIASLPVNEDDDGTGLSFGERARKYRRDYFAYGDWERHRDSNRFIGNLLDIFNSGIVRQLSKECLFITNIAIFVVLYNSLLVTGFTDFFGIFHNPIFPDITFPLLAIPAAFFTLTGFALSLLLVFRTNVGYQRWDEARKNWGYITVSCMTIMREASVWVQSIDTIPSNEKHRLLARIAAACWLFPRAMTRHTLNPTEDEQNFQNDCKNNLRDELATDIISSRHRPTRAIYELSCAINDLPIMDWRRVKIDFCVNTICDAMGSNERIFTSPVPRFYTKHTARFLELWLLLLPFTLYSNFTYTWNSWFTIPATVIISFFFLGIEELGIQLEEPFSVLPMHKCTNEIGKSSQEHLQWFLNDDEELKSYQ